MSRNPVPPDAKENAVMFEALKRQVSRNRLAQFFSDALRHEPSVEAAMWIADALEVWQAEVHAGDGPGLPVVNQE